MSAFETNAHWRDADEDWLCPACSRSKHDIVRETASGKKVAKIVIHHDHIYEHVRKVFAPHIDDLMKRFGTSRYDLEEQVFKPIQYSSRAFFDCHICEDCNSADPEAKKIVGAPRYVSFPPWDIARFISVSPNLKHKVDRESVKAVWKERKPQFDMRDRYLKGHLKMILDGDHWLCARAGGGGFRR